MRVHLCVFVTAGLEFSSRNENAASVSELEEMLAVSMRVREKSEADKMVLDWIGVAGGRGV